jgi:hypothetical protein
LPPERRVYIQTGYGGVAVGAAYTGSSELVNNLIPSSRTENGSGYVIYRATGLNGPWTALATMYTQSPDITPSVAGGTIDLTATGINTWYYYSGAGYKTGVGGSSFLYTIPSSNVVSGRGAPVINATGGHYTNIIPHYAQDGLHSSTNYYLSNYVIAYKCHTYTGTANFVTNANSPTGQLTVVLLAGGGGAGGKNQGGGGGGGGLLSLSGSTAPTVNPNTTYTITIGAGASSNLGGGTAAGANGGNSIAFGYTGYGGGGGGGWGQNGADGGCGGGAGGNAVGGAPKTGYGWLGNNTYSGRQGLSGHSALDGGNGGGGGGLFPNNTYNSVLNGKEPTNFGNSGSQYGYARYINSIPSSVVISPNISAGGGAGGDVYFGYGGGGLYTNPGNSGAGQGNYNWGADYYGDPAGKGYDATSYGCGGGGGGKGGGGGGAGFRGICHIIYPVSGGFVDAKDYGRVFATGG